MSILVALSLPHLTFNCSATIPLEILVRMIYVLSVRNLILFVISILLSYLTDYDDT
jgi:hypothetical protein